MKRRLAFAALCLITLIAASGIAAAQSPFVGTWKLNQSKSRLAGDTMKFEPAAGDSIQLAAGGTQYSFRLDGKPYRMASGDLAIWKQIDQQTWSSECTKPNGEALYQDRWTLTADGKNLSIVTTGTKPNGEVFRNEADYVRTSTGSGLMGSWKSTEIKLSSPNELTIQPYGLDGLILKIAAIKATCLATFDGKDVVPTGPTIPPGLTLAMARTGPRSFSLTQKVNGKPIYFARYTVGQNGKTLTEVGNSPGDPPDTAVWEKQ